jgi:SAM-dependent methyltransferase
MALLPNDPAGGWNTSAAAWIRFVDEGDVNRTHLLDPLMLELCGEVAAMRVLDVGCGEGRFCRMLRARGAQTVGLDPTRALIEEARKRDPHGSYLLADAVKLPLADASFDLCVSYVSLVDIEDYRRAIAELARVLKPGGCVVFANLQPYATTNMNGWAKDAAGKKLCFPIDNYTTERALIGRWRGIEVVQYHRPLGAIMTAFLATGLILRRFIEPVATAEARRAHPILEDDQRLPLFVVLEWTKPESTRG